MSSKNKLSKERSAELLQILEKRFEKNMPRHKGLVWDKVKTKLEKNPDKLWSLNQMEETDGEPDVVEYDKQNDEYTFFDCAPESPKARRSICYDVDAWESRKEFKPKHSAQGMAAEMGIEILNEAQFRYLQQLGKFDTKTSSWLNTPKKIRDLGGAIFGDFRFDTVFIYHNGAESYYAGRGFRGCLRV
jgi:hypothetical protein